MKKKIQISLAIIGTLALLVFSFFFFPRIWGEMVYPLEYPDLIKNAAVEFNVRPNLICAIIYTESHFNARAHSGAGAMGLMQIMPRTGASIANDLGDKNFSTDKLYDPATNIRYGTYYIKGLLDKYPGREDAAFGSYNAGVPRVDRWLEGNGSLPTETVYFIKKIKNAEAAYEKIYGAWYATPEVKKPNPFYAGIEDINTFIRGLILGQK